MEPKDGTVLFYPYISKSSFSQVKKVLSGRWIGQGPLVDKFENKFKNMFAGQNHCIATGSGTDALHLAYILAGLKKGDEVVVITGRDKGKRGAVVRLVKSDRVLVEGVNRVKKHEKPNPNKGSSGGIIEKEMSLQ